jgi:hypothetical protein
MAAALNYFFVLQDIYMKEEEEAQQAINESQKLSLSDEVKNRLAAAKFDSSKITNHIKDSSHPNVMEIQRELGSELALKG